MRVEGIKDKAGNQNVGFELCQHACGVFGQDFHFVEEKAESHKQKQHQHLVDCCFQYVH